MYDKLIQSLLENGAKKATKFITKNEIIRAVRTSYSGKFSKGNLEITITRGKPNFVERETAKRIGNVDGITFFKYLPQKKKAPKRKST